MFGEIVTFDNGRLGRIQEAVSYGGMVYIKTIDGASYQTPKCAKPMDVQIRFFELCETRAYHHTGDRYILAEKILHRFTYCYQNMANYEWVATDTIHQWLVEDGMLRHSTSSLRQIFNILVTLRDHGLVDNGILMGATAWNIVTNGTTRSTPKKDPTPTDVVAKCPTSSELPGAIAAIAVLDPVPDPGPDPVPEPISDPTPTNVVEKCPTSSELPGAIAAAIAVLDPVSDPVSDPVTLDLSGLDPTLFKSRARQMQQIQLCQLYIDFFKANFLPENRITVRVDKDPHCPQPHRDICFCLAQSGLDQFVEDHMDQTSQCDKASAFDKALREMHCLGWTVEFVCGPRKEEIWFSYSSNSGRAPPTM